MRKSFNPNRGVRLRKISCWLTRRVYGNQLRSDFLTYTFINPVPVDMRAVIRKAGYRSQQIQAISALHQSPGCGVRLTPMTLPVIKIKITGGSFKVIRYTTPSESWRSLSIAREWLGFSAAISVCTATLMERSYWTMEFIDEPGEPRASLL